MSIILLGLILGEIVLSEFQILLFISVIGFIVCLICLLFSQVNKNSKKIDVNIKNIDTIWDFQMRRATSELSRKNLEKKKNPLAVNPEIREWMKELADDLRSFYVRLGRHLNERELTMEIERLFGNQILEKVCIPHGLTQGECLLIASEVAKEVVSKIK